MVGCHAFNEVAIVVFGKQEIIALGLYEESKGDRNRRLTFSRFVFIRLLVKENSFGTIVEDMLGYTQAELDAGRAP